MKRTPKERNSRDTEHKTEEIEATKDYSQEASPYQDWWEGNSGYDPLDMEEVADDNPNIIGPVEPSDVIQDQWEGFKDVYPLLLGRQKELADLLLGGQWNQEAIAIQMGISQQAVNELLGKIRKKIEKVVTKGL